jgi:hypothetical protein
MAELRKIGVTPVGLEIIEGIDRDREAQATHLAEAEAVLAEWELPPDVDAALDYYTALVDLVQGRIRRATGASDVNDALKGILAGMWCELDPDREHKRLLVEFALRIAAPSRSWLPPAYAGYQPIEPPSPSLDASQTSHLTSVM